MENNNDSMQWADMTNDDLSINDNIVSNKDNNILNNGDNNVLNNGDNNVLNNNDNDDNGFIVVKSKKEIKKQKHEKKKIFIFQEGWNWHTIKYIKTVYNLKDVYSIGKSKKWIWWHAYCPATKTLWNFKHSKLDKCLDLTDSDMLSVYEKKMNYFMSQKKE